MRKPHNNGGNVNTAALLASYALGLVSSYLLPAAATVIILAVGLLILGICRIRC